MLCTNGETWTPPKKGGVYYMCRLQGYEYCNRQCKWVKWCSASKSYVPKTGDDGFVCPEYTTKIMVVDEVKEEPMVAQATIDPEPRQVGTTITEELVTISEPKIRIFVDETKKDEPKFEPELDPIEIEHEVNNEKLVSDEMSEEHSYEENQILGILKSKHPSDSIKRESYLSKCGKK